jgi:hypothetical protein
MDVYHQVLAKLFEVTEGRATKSVDFKDLVRSIGFHGNYPDIFERLSREGWIAEDRKPNFVFITHWGISEVKKTSSANFAEKRERLPSEINKAIAETRELTALLEALSKDSSTENFDAAERKFQELAAAVERLRANFK